MPRYILPFLLLTAVAQAQNIPGLTPLSAAQQKAVKQNAQAFTGRICKAYGSSLREVPANISPEAKRQALNFAFNYMLDGLKQHGITPTKVQRTQDGGGAIYVAADGSFVQVVSVNVGNKTFQGSFSCALK
ncbi:hypothetical protein WDJ50_02655 [Deinococcus sp. VB142]|uniref:Uncharacterized protein n=1 Tax=Deinococcus sp. VB142 TaxID=3112952 RepID=A0AAU6Q464_9DEIO